MPISSFETVVFINKVGIFLQDVAAGLHFVQEYQPKAVLLMDASPQQIQYVRDNSPLTEVVFWKHEGNQRWDVVEPEYWAETIWAQIADCPPEYVYCQNEPLGHDATNLFAAYDNWQARFIRRMRQLSGGQVKVGAFCFPEGNFTKNGPDIPVNFPQSMDEAEIVFIHEYWKPRLRSEGMVDYHCLRWCHWLEQFDRVGRSDLEVCVTECGMTMAVGGGPDVGYLSEEAMATGLTWREYRNDLEDYHSVCCLEPRIRFMIPFLTSPWPGQWQTFRLDINPELLGYLMTMKAPGGEVPENGGNMRIIGFNNETKDWAWLKSVFGDKVVVHPITEKYQPQNGEWVYKIDYLDARVGETSCIINVKDENGNPVEGETTVFYWPSADPVGYPNQPWFWTTVGATGDTNADGDCGPGMGPGAYYSPADNEEGPHSVWIIDLAAEMVSGIGMIPGGDPDLNAPGEEGPHAHLNIGYKRVQWSGDGGGGPTPPPDGDIPPMDGSLLDRVLELEAQVRSLGTLDVSQMLNTINQIKSLLAG